MGHSISVLDGMMIAMTWNNGEIIGVICFSRKFNWGKFCANKIEKYEDSHNKLPECMQQPLTANHLSPK